MRGYGKEYDFDASSSIPGSCQESVRRTTRKGRFGVRLHNGCLDPGRVANRVAYAELVALTPCLENGAANA
jgi:hypothetical protein